MINVSVMATLLRNWRWTDSWHYTVCSLLHIFKNVGLLFYSLSP